MKKYIFFALLFTQHLFSQLNFDEKILLNNSLKSIDNIDFTSAKNNIAKISNKSLYINLDLYREIIQFSGQTLSKKYFLEKINNSYILKENYVIINLIKGYSELYYNLNNPNSFQYFFNAYLESKKLNNNYLLKESIKAILNLYGEGILQNMDWYKKYLEELKRKSRTKSNQILSIIYEMQLLGLTIPFGSEKEEQTEKKLLIKQLNKKKKELISLVKTSSNKNINHIALYRIANQYLIKKDIGKAAKIYKKILTIKKYPYFFKRYKFNSLIKLSYISFLKKHKDSTFYYLNQARKYENTIKSFKTDLAINHYSAIYLKNQKKFELAFFALEKANKLEYKLNFLKANEVITQLETYNQTKEKEKEILISQQKNKNLLFGSLIIFSLGSIIVFLTLKNSRRKRLLAFQEKELEIQKNLTLLKEQEITTINAMIDGQEKERTRIAEDLHDNLGSVLATLKLHFENLKLNQEKKKLNQEELFNRTENLIDEAYLRVRKIAHAKNAGVIANQGLLSAIQTMVEKISTADRIKIEVIHFGLDKRLDNSLEITVFRIVQELITNCLKHALASHITINLSQFDNNLNIIVEDNGKGFTLKSVDLKNTMGLHSIQTRIQHLNGSFEIDSTLEKGTSIIFNIPLN